MDLRKRAGKRGWKLFSWRETPLGGMDVKLPCQLVTRLHDGKAVALVPSCIDGYGLKR